MIEDDSSTQSGQSIPGQTQTSFPSGSFSPPKKWKAPMLLFVLVAAAGIVLAHSLIKKSNVTDAPDLWGPELDALAALDDVAADVDAVFILICGRDQRDAETIIGEIEAATKEIRLRGNRASAFRLKESSLDYVNLAEQLSVPTVLAMVKGLGYSAVSERITEANLLEAFVKASEAPPACCPPGTDPSQCTPSGSD